ncbi:MAG: hypothetical protein H3C49_02485 [Alphaproteobacteria bacterium]|nr:hypothetical protein [Alphaproteobacteria bacterium]
MSENYVSLSKEFNQTAQAIGAGEGNWQMAVAKFTLLMRHKAQTTEQKQELCAMMMNAAVNRLEKVLSGFAEMDNFTASTLEGLYGVFRPLAAPENLPYLPKNASAQLADVTLDMVRALEDYKKTPSILLETYNSVRKYYTEFSFFMLETAQTVKTAEEERSASAETQSDLTLGKTPTIKQRHGNNGKTP